MKIFFYLFSVAFVALGVYTCILAVKEEEDRKEYIVHTIFSFLMSAVVFYFGHWGIIIK